VERVMQRYIIEQPEVTAKPTNGYFLFLHEKIIWFIKGGLLLNVNSDIMAFSFL